MLPQIFQMDLRLDWIGPDPEGSAWIKGSTWELSPKEHHLVSLKVKG